jgi:murein DD-endopeptidase MepM/ murein hydrolase activator NlpD
MRTFVALVPVALASFWVASPNERVSTLTPAADARSLPASPAAASSEHADGFARPVLIRRSADARGTIEVSWTPTSPRQGTLFVVRARILDVTNVKPSGVLSGEPLHFEQDSSGGWWALAAVAVDHQGPAELIVQAETGAGREEARAQVTIAPGSYSMERLSVAPAFTDPPSPELQARMDRESERALAVARGAHDSQRMWTPGAVQRPRSTRITSGFGNGREFNGQVESRHMGTDFAGAVGEAVLAPADGVVRIVDQFYLGGNVIYIDHGGGLSSAYLHLSATSVAEGDRVKAGQRIGSVGATGRVTGPHLHWIVRYGGVTVDPLSLFEIQP